MAAPNWQASGTPVVVTSGNLTLTPPAHLTNDIFVAVWAAWLPNSTAMGEPSLPSGWTLGGTYSDGADGRLSWYWKRAASGSEGTVVFTRPAGWDTGTDGCWYGHIFTVRGCITTGNPWDAANAWVTSRTVLSLGTVTVLGTERTIIDLYAVQDNTALGTTTPGFTQRTNVSTATGTDALLAVDEKQNVSSDEGTSSRNITDVVNAAPATAGVVRISFKPPVPPANPTISSASVTDAMRNWSASTTEIELVFSEAVRKQGGVAYAVGDTVAGLTLQINGGANLALTYVSGDSTTTWRVKRAELLRQGQTLVLDYVQASGVLYDLTDTDEVAETVDRAATNSLTKRARLAVKKSDNNPAASETVKYGLHEYDGGAPANANWMSRSTKGTAATDASGNLDVEYTGAAAVGANIYVAVIRPDTSPTESFLWHQVVD